ncbi:hypothetical protein F5B18DRAFT_196985 [Nemania serpens]|nr:hypothetical protein F5B18DRAFT_196985 [Nemania serpens]
MKSNSAIVALLAVPAVMCCPRHGGVTKPKPSIAVPVIVSTATPTTVSIPVSALASSSVLSASAASSASSGSSAVTGTSTFYGGNLNGGTCSFTTYTLPSGVHGTAFSGSKWNSAAHCGACVQVTANEKSIIAMVGLPNSFSFPSCT